ACDNRARIRVAREDRPTRSRHVGFHSSQESVSIELNCALFRPGSTLASREVYTSLSFSVIAPECSRTRNSVTAFVYNLLRDTLRRFAADSARRKTSSGMDTAVFIP